MDYSGQKFTSDPRRMHPNLRIVLAQFSLWVVNGSVGHPILENVDYSEVLQEPSAMEPPLSDEDYNGHMY